MRVHFIVHGGRKSALELEMYLAAHQPSDQTFYFHRTSSREDIFTIIREFREVTDLLVVLGGDGLFSLSVKALLQNEGKIPVLALVPCGSGNDFARNFNWTASGSEFLSRLEKWCTKRLDSGVISNGMEEDIFINETSSGISNVVVGFVERKPQKWSGNIKFGISIFQAFLTFRRRYYEIEWEGGFWKGEAMLVACCNGRSFGSGIGIAPDASLDDGYFELVIIGKVNLYHYVRFLPRLRRSQRINHSEVFYFRVEKIKIHSDGGLERDGEPGLSLPATVEVKQNALEILL